MATNQGKSDGKLTRPAFKDPPRYKLTEKAFFGSVKVHQQDEEGTIVWVPLEQVLLNPEEQPLVRQLSGPFDNKGGGKRRSMLIEYEGIPDDHMDPVNEAANWMMDHIDDLKAQEALAAPAKRRRSRNPVDDLSIVGVA